MTMAAPSIASRNLRVACGAADNDAATGIDSTCAFCSRMSSTSRFVESTWILPAM